MIIGLDLGTTSLCAVLFDSEPQRVVRSAICANTAGIEGLPETHHEQNPITILKAASGLIQSLVRESGVPCNQITGLALTGQQHGLVVVDAKLNPLTNLITWRDQRASSAPIELRRHAYASETGCFLHPGYGGLTLHHLLRYGGLPPGAYKVLPVTGFVAAQLTGRCSVDETMAASWGILDVQTRRWHGPLLGKLSIPEDLLPEIVPSCSPLSRLVSCSTGLDQPTIIFSAMGDNQAGFAGVRDVERPEAVVNLGTSAQLSVFCSQYSFSPQLEIRPFPGGGFLRVYAALCGGWAYGYLASFFQQVLQQLGGVTVSLEEIYDRMQAFASITDAGGLGADTRFAGERNGGTVAGSIVGINTTNFTPANLVRAFAQGIAAELAGASHDLRLEATRSLAVVGNAAQRNPILLRALEKQFGMPCRVLNSGGEAALGAARLTVELNHRLPG